MIIYKTTNLLNGRFYIGKDEKNDSNYLGSGKILKLAINKNGRENFKKEILEFCDTRKELNEREKHWINILSATTVGYNIADGGTGGKTKFNTTHVYQYNKDGYFIKEWVSAAEIERVLKIDQSAITKACKGKLLSVNGFIWSYEYFQNGSNEYVDKKSFKVLQYTKDGLFLNKWDSMSKAEKSLNLTRGNIYRVLNDTSKSSGGFIWIKNLGEIKNKIEINKFIKHNIKPIHQYDENMVLINEWVSMSEATYHLKLNLSMLSMSIKNKTLYKNYYWVKIKNK